MPSFTPDCGRPDVPDNCDVALLGGTVYRSLAVYSCHLGYYTNDTKSRVCQAQGSWSNAAPTCHIVGKQVFFQNMNCEHCDVRLT